MAGIRLSLVFPRVRAARHDNRHVAPGLIPVLDGLRRRGVQPKRIAAFVLEGYQGIGGPKFYPPALCPGDAALGRCHQALVIFDEIQYGIGRTGKFFAHEHYGVEADLVCCGNGISSCLPLSAVLGRA